MLRHSFTGLSETVTVRHAGIAFDVRVSRKRAFRDELIRVDFELPPGLRWARSRINGARGEYWYIIEHEDSFMRFKAFYPGNRGMRPDVMIMFDADLSWEFDWRQHTSDVGVPIEMPRSIRHDFDRNIS